MYAVASASKPSRLADPGALTGSYGPQIRPRSRMRVAAAQVPLRDAPRTAIRPKADCTNVFIGLPARRAR